MENYFSDSDFEAKTECENLINSIYIGLGYFGFQIFMHFVGFIITFLSFQEIYDKYLHDDMK